MASSQHRVLNDPRYRYPGPEFRPQPQDLPGHEARMEPRPDHGEESYRGSGRLEGIVAFFHFSRAALRHLPPGGAIINSTSIQASDPSGGLSPYAATKAAIANFTMSLASLAIEQGVRVNAVAPGPVWTPLIPATFSDDKLRSFGSNTLFGRPAQPAELAPVYVFLASREASFVSGEIYGVTGGRMPL